MTNTPMTFEEWFEQWRASTWKPLPSDARQDLPRHWAMNAQNHMSIAWQASQAHNAKAIAELVEMCAKIAEKYEPEEKQSYIDYASKEIRRTLPAIISANQGSDKARE